MRWLVYAFSALLVGAVVAPGVIPGARDDFPLSTYPMFSRQRPDTMWAATARGVKADGKRTQIAAEDIASSEPMQALSTLKRAMNGGPRAANELCETIAARVRRDPDLVAVELRWERYPVVEYFLGETEPRAVKRVAQCRIDRTGGVAP